MSKRLGGMLMRLNIMQHTDVMQPSFSFSVSVLLVTSVGLIFMTLDEIVECKIHQSGCVTNMETIAFKWKSRVYPG